MSWIISYGICRITITLNTKFNFVSLIAYSFVDPICPRVVKMRKVFLLITLMISGIYDYNFSLAMILVSASWSYQMLLNT